MSEPILTTVRLGKQFGALRAVFGVSLEFEPGVVHAIIGPNGAGKTTLINLLSGNLPPSDGSIHYRGQDITGLSPDRISQLGVGRSFQKTNIFPTFTCFENCWLAAQSRRPSSMRFFRPARRLVDVEARALNALETCGLGERRDTVAAEMSYGEQRQLEIGMMLATEPDLLLLDEPLAGMGSEEATQVIGLLRRLAEEHTLILIEHDMDAVFAIADLITVMVNGEVLKTGSVEQIRNSAEVQQAYLGVEEDEA
ncbi:MAG: ATP-binding cassette domain-containing protein [Gammaproteobacteria bacterium]|nr:ATP-binding cassette domain-containing protein [Gammaproteobacteria bacterium]